MEEFNIVPWIGGGAAVLATGFVYSIYSMCKLMSDSNNKQREEALARKQEQVEEQPSELDDSVGDFGKKIEEILEETRMPIERIQKLNEEDQLARRLRYAPISRTQRPRRTSGFIIDDFTIGGRPFRFTHEDPNSNYLPIPLNDDSNDISSSILSSVLRMRYVELPHYSTVMR